MERPKPTRNLILNECGNDQTLISSLHHGLRETSALNTIYPFLNFDDLVVFAASSWKTREQKDLYFAHLATNAGIYAIFD